MRLFYSSKLCPSVVFCIFLLMKGCFHSVFRASVPWNWNWTQLISGPVLFSRLCFSIVAFTLPSVFLLSFPFSILLWGEIGPNWLTQIDLRWFLVLFHLNFSYYVGSLPSQIRCYSAHFSISRWSNFHATVRALLASNFNFTLICICLSISF